MNRASLLRPDPGVSSAAVNLLVVSAAAFSVFVVAEVRRVGMRRAWLFIPLGVLVAMGLAVPMFLLVRERRLVR